MDTLVDVFYYDYILSKIVKMYETDTPIDSLVSYLKIATVLSRKFRIEKISPLDTQLYLKEAYVKILQVLRMESNDSCSTIEKVFDCFTTLSMEYGPLEDEKAFIKMKMVLLSIYEKRQGSNKENNETSKTQRLLIRLEEDEKDGIKQLIAENNIENIIKYLKGTLKFDTPVMMKFTGFIKKEIEEERKITTGDSPGTRIGW